MPWSRSYAIRSYLGSSLWLVPFLALLAEQIVFHAAIAVDNLFDLTPSWPLNEAGTTAALQTIITISLSFLVFAFGSILVAIQVAGGQLTPRLIATTLLRDNAIRFIVGLFVFTLIFSIGAVSRTGDSPPRLVAWIAILSGFGSITAFLYLIDHCARLLRPVSLVWLVGEQGKRVIESVYPLECQGDDTIPPTDKARRSPDRIIYHGGVSAVVIAVNVDKLHSEAERHAVTIEVVPRIGDFVGSGEPLLHFYGESKDVDEGYLKGLVAFGPERTMEQDPTFALRVIVDIAIKALSNAINDPTTAVLAIDQLQRLLRNAGMRNLHDEVALGNSGRTRVVLRTPNWEDFVELAIREIRSYGAENLQVARRLRAMITALVETLPDTRTPALLRELELLEQAIELCYPLEDDRKLAHVADMQGLGGASSARAPTSIPGSMPA